MSPELVGLLGIALLFVLFALRVPVGIAMLLVAFLGYAYLTRLNVGLAQLGMSSFGTASSYSLSVMPLFILMGMILSHSEIGSDLFKAVGSWMGHLRGGLAIATIGACAVFAAIAGSTTATTATIGSVALPEMRKKNYNAPFSLACIAVGGTLGILIPPSVILIIYGVLTMEPIGKLLIAGILPGILMTMLFMATIYLQVRLNPSCAPLQPKSPNREKIDSLLKVWPVLLVFPVSIGGIYLGIFTPTEGGGVGAFITLLIALLTKRLNWESLISALEQTIRINAMIFLILIAATLFGQFLAVTKIPMQATSFVGSLNVSPYVILAALLVLYVILGCFMEGIAIMVLTIPIVYPIIIDLGFNGIWFGVIMVMLLNIGLVTPPVGINVYVAAGLANDVPLHTIFRFTSPLLLSIIVCTILLVIFPQIVTFLPSLMH